MAGKLKTLTGAIIGGVAGLIVGIVVLSRINGTGDSLAIVDPEAPATATLMLAAAFIIGALAGGVITTSRR